MTLLVLSALAIIMLNTMGCGDPGQPAQPAQKRNVLNVYLNEGTGNEPGAILIAKIRVEDGKINLTQLSVYPENEKLEQAIPEIEARPGLGLTYEDMEDGKLMMYVINVTPEDQNYLYALRDVLLFDYGINSAVSKETVRT